MLSPIWSERKKNMALIFLHHFPQKHLIWRSLFFPVIRFSAFFSRVWMCPGVSRSLSRYETCKIHVIPLIPPPPILLRNKLQCTTRTEHVFLLCPGFIYFWTATRVNYIYILSKEVVSVHMSAKVEVGECISFAVEAEVLVKVFPLWPSPAVST